MRSTPIHMPGMLRKVTLLAILLMLIVAATSTSGAPTRAAGRTPYISPEVAVALKSQGSARVIITLVVNSTIQSPAAFKSEIASAQSMALFAMPAGSFTLTSQFKTIPALSGTITSDGLRAISNHPGVLAINLDKEVFVSEISASVVRDAESDLLTRATQLNALGYTGDGSRVGIIDTGIDTDHPSTDLVSDLFHEQCFRTEGDCVGGPSSAEDQHSHGTHVAGIITGLHGVAPDTEFAALKVFTVGSTSDTNILNALDYAGDNDATLQLDAINMSLGGGLYVDQASCDADNAAYVASFAALNGLGITVFVATGNDYSTSSVSSPGCVTGAVGVGSVDDDFGVWDGHSAPDAVTSFSNATPLQGPGELVDILSTGCAILSEVPPNLNGGLEFDNFCGTSMATPTAAGVFAALLEFEPSLTPAQAEDLLETSGDLVVDDRAGMGNMLFPRVDAMNAYGALTLEQPTGLIVTVISPTEIDLEWDDVSGETEYVIERSEDGVNFTEIGGTPADDVDFSDTDVPCGLLTYRVKSGDGAAYSLPSDPASDTARTCPNAPTDLVATVISDTQVDLEWTDNATDEDYYSIERKAPGETAFTEIDTVAGDAYSDTDADCGLHEYRVRAFRDSDDSYSAYSNVAAAAPCAPDNDLWENAEVVSSDTYNDVEPEFTHATFTATDPSFPCHFNGNVQAGESLWYSFTPTTDGELTVNTVGSTSSDPIADTVLAIVTGSPGSFTMIACNDDIDINNDVWLSEIADEPLTSGTTYYIIAANWAIGINIDEMHVNFEFVPDGSVTPTATATDDGPTATPTDPGPTETPTEEPGTDLVQNGGFENLGSDGKPDLTPWVVKNSSGDKAKCNKDKDGDGIPDKIFANTGECAFQFKNVVGEAGKLEQTLDLTGVVPVVGDSLDLSLAAQTKGGATGKAKAVFKYDDDTKTKITIDITESVDYTVFTGSETLTGTTITKAKLNINSKSTSGKIYVDDVALIHTSSSGLTGRGNLLPLPPSSSRLGSNN